MKIAIDNISPGASTTVHSKGGMRMYLENLLGEMATQYPQHHFLLITPDWNMEFNFPRRSNIELKSVAGVPKGRMSRVLFEQCRYASIADKLGCDAFLGLCNSLPLSLKTPSAVVVQSTQFQFVPESYGFLQRNYLRFTVSRAVKKADAVITVSEHSKDDVVKWTGVPSDKVFAVHHGSGVAGQAEPKAVEELRKRYGVYALCVSSFYPYKNLMRLVEAFAQFKSRHPESSVNLVMIGDDTEGLKVQDLKDRARALGIENAVMFPGRVPHELIRSYYAAAEVLAMPSLYETFGLPILEAMAMGCPVITSQASSMPEVAGNAAELVDPYDTTSISNALERVLLDRKWREELVRRGKERIKAFSWGTAAQKTVQVLERVAKDNC